MDLAKKRGLNLFILTLLFTLFLPALFPSCRLLFFAPFLVVMYYQKSLSLCLYFSFLCGIILDLLSTSFIGLHALNFCLVTIFLYSRQRNFFSDNLSTLPLMTFFFSLLSTLLDALLIHTFESTFPFSLKWVFADVFIMPALDASYAFVCFILPFYAFGKRRRRGKDYFLSNGYH